MSHITRFLFLLRHFILPFENYSILFVHLKHSIESWSSNRPTCRSIEHDRFTCRDNSPSAMDTKIKRADKAHCMVLLLLNDGIDQNYLFLIYFKANTIDGCLGFSCPLQPLFHGSNDGGFGVERQ